MNLYQPTITGSLSVSGSVNISGSITIAGGGTISGTASIATNAITASSADNFLVRNTLTAQTLVVQTITSSVDFVTGSTRFGSILTNTHVFSGSVSMNPNGLFVSSSGNVGIGTITPNAYSGYTTLTVNNTNSGSVLDLNRSGTRTGTFYADTSGVGIGSLIATNLDIFTGNSYIALQTSGSERMRITSAGNVGIGTSTPNFTSVNRTTVDINGPIQSLLSFSSGGTPLSYIFNDGYNFTLNTASGYMNFQVSGSERMRITSGGNVGINNTTPSTYLDVSNNGTNNNAYITTRNTGINGYRSGAIFTNSAAGGLSWYLVSTNNGDGDWGGGKFAISTNNAVGVYLNGSTATTWTGQSDIRLKDIDSEIENAIDKVNKLRGVRFTWKSDETKKMQVGLIAQEVKEVLPEAVDFDETNEDYRMGVQYTDLIPLLVNAIKEQQIQIQNLQEQINILAK